MPNGISCAYFAIKSYKVAKEDENVFRGGIAGIQTVRTLDAVSSAIGALPAASVMSLGGKAAKASAPVGASFGSTLPPICHKAGKFLSGMAKFGRKLVYPLIVLSGILNTARAEDKVKTGVSQASGIGLMYASETIAEKFLNPITHKIESSAKPWVKGAWAVARGLIYVGASLGGYDIGNKFASSIVDKVRGHKLKKTKEKFETINANLPNNNQNTVFSTMKLD